MLEKRGKLVRLGAGALISVILGTVPLAAVAADIETTKSAMGIWFQLPESQDSVLSVSGPGAGIYREFEAGEAPQFDGIDDNGNPLADGNYYYEVHTAPEQDQEALLEADAANDAARLAELWEEAQAHTHVASGEFEIAMGQFVFPDKAVEDEAVEAGVE